MYYGVRIRDELGYHHTLGFFPSSKYEPMAILSTSPLLANEFINDESLIDLIETSDLYSSYDDSYDYCYHMVLDHSEVEKNINRTINVLSNLEQLNVY